jgi:hypothetical protein
LRSVLGASGNLWDKARRVKRMFTGLPQFAIVFFAALSGHLHA